MNTLRLTYDQVMSHFRMNHLITAQEWTNSTLIGHEPLLCSKMCFAKTELVQ